MFVKSFHLNKYNFVSTNLHIIKNLEWKKIILRPTYQNNAKLKSLSPKGNIISIFM